MRARGAGVLQLILMSLGLALVIRYAIQYVWGTEIRALDVAVYAAVAFAVISGRSCRATHAAFGLGSTRAMVSVSLRSAVVAWSPSRMPASALAPFCLRSSVIDIEATIAEYYTPERIVRQHGDDGTYVVAACTADGDL